MARRTMRPLAQGGYSADGAISNWAAIDAMTSELYASEIKRASLTVDEADIATGSGAKTFDIVTLAGEACIIDAGLALAEVFAGGSLSGCTASIGVDVGPDVDALVTAQDVFTGAATGARVSPRGVALAEATRQPILASGKKVQLTLTPTGDSLINATTGNVTAWVLYRLTA